MAHVTPEATQLRVAEAVSHSVSGAVSLEATSLSLADAVSLEGEEDALLTEDCSQIAGVASRAVSTADVGFAAAEYVD